MEGCQRNLHSHRASIYLNTLPQAHCSLLKLCSHTPISTIIAAHFGILQGISTKTQNRTYNLNFSMRTTRSRDWGSVVWWRGRGGNRVKLRLSQVSINPLGHLKFPSRYGFNQFLTFRWPIIILNL